MQKKCALCLEVKDLRKSHAIPNSIFKKIFRENSGKAITFADDESDVGYTTDTWWQYQLCAECESHLNKEFEQYSISALRGKVGKVYSHDSGVTFEGVDLLKLKLFFLSIFWRAANSQHDAYRKVYIPEPLNSSIRISIQKANKVSLSLATVKISSLIDKTPKNGFTLEHLKSIVVSPFFRKLKNQFSFCFLIEGFFIEIFTPGVKIKYRNTSGILDPSKKIFMAPHLDIFDIPEIVKLMVSGYGKHVNGRVTFKS